MAAQINICPRLESQVMWLYKWNAYKGRLELLKKKNKCHCQHTQPKQNHNMELTIVCSTIICRIWMAVKFSVSKQITPQRKEYLYTVPCQVPVLSWGHANPQHTPLYKAHWGQIFGIHSKTISSIQLEDKSLLDSFSIVPGLCNIYRKPNTQ